MKNKVIIKILLLTMSEIGILYLAVVFSKIIPIRIENVTFLSKIMNVIITFLMLITAISLRVIAKRIR
jgi:hypothetical protein